MILGAVIVIIAAQIIVNLVQGWLQMRHFPLHPAVVMVLLTIGGYIASYWGMILALPVGQPYGKYTSTSKTSTRAGRDGSRRCGNWLTVTCIQLRWLLPDDALRAVQPAAT